MARKTYVLYLDEDLIEYIKGGLENKRELSKVLEGYIRTGLGSTTPKDLLTELADVTKRIVVAYKNGKIKLD